MEWPQGASVLRHPRRKTRSPRAVSDRDASTKTGEHGDEVAPERVENLMAGHAARRWILEVRLHHRVDEVFLARFWKIDAVVMWVDWMGVGRPLVGLSLS